MITEKEEKSLSELREKIKTYESGKRLTHTYSVEREITSLAGIYEPHEEYRLRAAALLHDITKQLDLSEQQKLCGELGISYTALDTLMPKTFHARTAVGVIKRDFPELADEFILSAVAYHTTGRAGMTIGEKLLYLADYIEDTRTFDDCIKLRRYFYSGLDKKPADTVLLDTLIMSFDMTIRGLIDGGTPIHPDAVEARNYLIGERDLEKQ